MAKENSQRRHNRKSEDRVKLVIGIQEGAEKTTELPFVLAVIAGLSGATKLGPLRDRQFIRVDRETFDSFLRSCKPSISIRVANKLKGDDSQLPVQLTFESLQDFSPERVVEKVDVLNTLFVRRNHLRDLLSQIGCMPRFEDKLNEVLADPILRGRLVAEAKHERASPSSN